MEWIETTAKTVEEAKDLALDQLHVDEADAEFEVLEEPRPGLFGRLRGEARVRARVRPVAPRPKVDRRDRRRPARRKGGDATPREVSDSSAERTDRDDSDVAEEGGTDANPSRNRRRSGRGRGGQGKAADSASDSSRAQSPRSQSSNVKRSTNEETTVSHDNDVTVQEQAEIVQGFVEGLVDAFGFNAEVAAAEIDEETVEVRVDGEDLGLLVGPRGATLQAIHDLSRSVVQRQATGTHHGRVRLDIAGYRERRRDALERFTQRLAETAIETGTAQALEPMSAADRKVVHDTANGIDGVHTVSEGEDARRHVVIVPDNT